MRISVKQARSEQELEQARELFAQYAESLEFDLEFQDFDSEMADFPGEYALPSGSLLLALTDDRVAGCVALRRIDDDICEMKRMYVLPEYQGRGLGRALAEGVIEQARHLGYLRMRLDTVPSMVKAMALYESLGFREIPAYRHNPIEGTRFMEIELGLD